MDKKIKAKWIKALRSGKYDQAKNTLLDASGAMCCLGVLAHIQGCNLRQLGEQHTLVTETLPRGMNAGLSVKQREGLAQRNDGRRGHEPHSFREIADYIAENL